MVLYLNSKYNRILFQITHCYSYDIIGRVKGSKASSSKQNFFGVGKPLQVNKLPLVSEVGSALAFEAFGPHEATDTVTKQVLNVYETASIPTIAKNKVKEKVHDL